MTATVFQIEDGQFGLTLIDKAEIGYLDAWQAPAGKITDTVTLADYETPSAWSCQATSGALNATPNVVTVDIPATFCDAASSVPQPSQTTYELAMTFLQDPNIVAGINRYLFENDTKEAYFYYGLDDGNPPRMIGRCRLIAGTIGGAARTTLTFDVVLPLSRKPDIEFGDTAASIIVNGDGTTTTPAGARAARGTAKTAAA